MSVELENFRQSCHDLYNHQVEFFQNTIKSYQSLLINNPNEFVNTLNSLQRSLNSKNIVEQSVILIYLQIDYQLVCKIFPNHVELVKQFIGLFEQFKIDSNVQNLEKNLCILIDLKNRLPDEPCQLTPTIINQALVSIKEQADRCLELACDNITWTEMVLNFLKSCANFLITMLTFGQKPNFFKSTTFELERIIRLQQDLHDNFISLTENEKKAPLEWPTTNFENPMLGMH